MKKLFNSIWFKCISTLLIIALISGGLLALLNDILFVSPEERTARAIKGIYGEEKQYETIIDIDNTIGTIYENTSYGSIDKVFKIENTNPTKKDYLFHATGINGYKNGTITLWVQVIIEDDVPTISKVVCESSEKQTLMSKLTDEYYNKFTNNYTIGQGNVVSGATKSSNACSNAVNVVLSYLQEAI